MATPKPQIKSTFATPLCTHFLPVANEVNVDLRALATQRFAVATNMLQGEGWRSDNDMESWGGNATQTLFRVLRELADGLTATRGSGRVSLDWKIAANASVMQKGDYRAMAARPGALWSGLYVVDDGYNKSDDENLGGEIELADPRGALPAMIAPQFAFRIPNGGSAGQTETIRPTAGMIIMHPSWQLRGERRYDGDSQRVTIEFDLT